LITYDNFNKIWVRFNGGLWISAGNSPEEAAEAYNAKARELFGKFAYQNEVKKVKKKA
jgi:hypothetical protein